MISLVNEELKWLAVYTQSRAEKKVFERLTKADFEAFLPLTTVVKQWSDRKKKVKVPLINSYVFVNTSRKNISSLLKIPGVVGVLKYLGKPAIIKDFEISNLKIIVNTIEEVELIDQIDLKEGVDVEVINGVFSGLLAKYITFSGKYRVIVELNTLKSFIAVNIPLKNIRKL
jgi:transcription antitermination factor NusG